VKKFTIISADLKHTVVSIIKGSAQFLNYIQSFQLCVTIAVIIITTTCVLGGRMRRFWSSIRNHACFLCDINLEYSRNL